MFPFLIILAVALFWPVSAWCGVVFSSDTDWKYWPGLTDASLGDPGAWRGLDFDDSNWPTGKAPFYYDNQPDSATAYTGNTELTDMLGNYTCVFLRKTFVVTAPNDVRELRLVTLSDDGFIAWINGAEVARFNVPSGEIPYNGTSLPALAEPVPIQTTVLDQASAHLVPGQNVIAVQALNASLASSSDFVISMEMSSSVDDTPPVVSSTIPAAKALVQQLTQVEVFFDEDVTGVEASALLINGTPATRVTAFNASQYVFEFPQPANGVVNLSWSPTQVIQDLASAPNAFAGGTWSYTLDPNSSPAGLQISEFMADNKKTLHDEDGDSSDWIELFNAGTTTASLNGYYLTVQSNRTQWPFPNVTLLPHTYLIVFASEKDRRVPTAQLHTNFKLDRTGGYLALLDPSGKTVSEFAAYPAQLRDISYGRERENPTLTGFFTTPTPGGANAVGGSGFSPPVNFSVAGGTFSSPFELILSTTSPEATIHYTVDGSLPTETSAAYSAPIPLSSTVQVRALSLTPGLLQGPPHSESYIALATNLLGFTSDLPVVVIHNFKGGRVPAGTRQFANISVFEPGYGRTSLTNAPSLSTRAGINLRGSSTLSQIKSNFRVEFWDDNNDGNNLPLLGMPADSDWILYACDNFEPVLIHNKFMHDLSRQIGRYSPRARFVEVYLNTAGGPVTQANYNGVYVLLEKIKQGKDRVDIAKLEPENSQPPEVTGGYLLSVDRTPAGEGQLYGGGLGINALNPKWDELIQPQRTPQFQYITGYLDELYSVLNSPNFSDPVNGYAKYVDVPAAIDHHLLNMLAFNVDALRLSAYFSKPREGKLTFGPLWDFDRALGSTDGRDSNPRVWRSTTPDYGTDMFNSDPIFSNPWYSRMFRDPDFWQHWIDRWQELRQNRFTLTNLHGLVDSLADQVREAEAREIVRWGSFTRPRGGSYQAEVDRMKTWLSNRVNFIDTNFLAAPLLSNSGGPIAAGFSLSMTAPAGATIYYTLDGTDPRAPAGEISNGAQAYSGPIVLAQNARVVARALDLNHRNLTGANKPPLSSPWSGASAATYVVTTPALAVTELMYHPASGSDGAQSPEDFEFIELKNLGTEALNLIGLQVTHGIEYTFTTASGVTTLGPGEYLLLVKNQAAFAARYPGINNIAGEYTGSLDNAGERVTLQGALGEPVLDFVYRNEWYPPTDGLGFSLVPVDENAPSTEASHASYWRVSSTRNGSPGQVELPPLVIAPVLINEALTHTDLPELDAVELFNPGTSQAPIGGWFLTDDPHNPKKYRIPAGTSIPAGGYEVFDATQFDTGPNAFALSSLGEAVFLFSGDGTELTGYSHGFTYGAAAHGVSFGRYVTSTGEEKFVAQLRNTLPGPNAGPKVGPIVISEIMFNPPALGTTNNTRDEYVELYNRTDQPVPLFDPAAATNTWQVSGGIEFQFPTNLTLQSGQTLLLLNFDPLANPAVLAAFAAQYAIDPVSLTLLGPFKGNLDNSSDRLTLLRPDPPEPPLSPKPGFVPYVVVDEVHYSNQAPWPSGASATGQSLQRIAPLQFGDDPINWRTAAATPGKVDAGLRIESVEVKDSLFSLQFQALAGETYSVLYRDALGQGSWLKLSDVLAENTARRVTVTDSAVAKASSRYYRIVTPAQL